MNDILFYLKKAVELSASDIFIVSGLPVSYKLHGSISPQEDEIVMPDLSMALISELYEFAKRPIEELLNNGDDDFSLSVKGISRFRVSAYKQRGSIAAIIRVVAFAIPEWESLHIPAEVLKVAREVKNGLVLVTGTAGSGKSTTLACMINEINKTRAGHIITLEEPIEFFHRNDKSVVSQREIPTDTTNYVTALRACMRQAPDVILVGEMRDYETIKAAMTAAETGHLVISSLHTVGAANSVDRIIDVFPPEQQQQIRVQLSMLLRTVISQQLVGVEGGSVYPAFEIMHTNSAIRTLIREAKVHQIDAAISSASSEGMISMDSSLIELYNKGLISKEDTLKYSSNYELMHRKIGAEKEAPEAAAEKRKGFFNK
jgi:pilus retraction protein PilT